MTRHPLRSLLIALSLHLAVRTANAADWQPAEGPLMTRWAADVSPEKVLPEYPRPQMVRPQWTNLNGLWEYAIRPREEDAPDAFDGQILVPFAVESALSGVRKPVGPDNRLWYRRRISPPETKDGERVLLHFGAVDWETTVRVNGRRVGEHRGGYDPFSFDITDALALAPAPAPAPAGAGSTGSDQGEGVELLLSVWDPSNTGHQPRGKQVLQPRGIFYTAVTGIWQTVWMEVVPAASIRGLKITPQFDESAAEVTVSTEGTRDGDELVLTVTGVRNGDNLRPFRSRPIVARGRPGQAIRLEIPNVQAWSPAQPWLYPLKVQLRREGRAVDTVESYFGMRKIEVRRADDGFNRLFLNNEPLFQFGPLDQGWWPDGLYTAATDEALRYDIEVTRRLNMNMARKHVKVEPARWYYWCDTLGLIVWQDMVSGDQSIRRNQPDLERTPESAATYRRELQAMIDALGNHPCIVAWVPFNEGWGQFETDAILNWTKEYDPTRLVDGPSGWADRGSGDMHDMHRYPGPDMPPPEEERAVVLGEFGGLGWPVAGHLWQDRRNWGYRTYHAQEALQENYEILLHKLRPLIPRGLAAAVYTQTSDVEGEVNGLMTYDREVIKLDVDRVRELHESLYAPPPMRQVRIILATSEREPQTWRYTTQAPAENWAAADFDDSDWQSGPGGFGRADTPGARAGTPWTSEDIWIRRTFTADEFEGRAHLRVHHDDEAEIYLNGRRIAALTGYTTGYFDMPLPASAKNALRAGENVLAVHCKQTGGGQYIDVGVLDVTEAR